MKSLVRGVLACSLVASLAVAASPAAGSPTVAARTFTGIQTGGVQDLVLDPTSGRAFTLGYDRSSGNELLVVAGGDTVEARLPFDARSLKADAEGDGVLLAVPLAQQVVSVDTATLEPTVFDTGPDTCPDDVVETSGLYWFTNAACDGVLRVLDPVSGAVTVPAGVRPGLSRLAAGAGLADTVMALAPTGDGSEDADLVALATGAGPVPTAVERAAARVLRPGSLVVRDGSEEVYVARHSGITVLAGRDLSEVRQLVSPQGSTRYRLAVSEGGWVAAGGGVDPVRVYPPGSATAQDVPGLSFDPSEIGFDGETLVVVGEKPRDVGYSLTRATLRHLARLSAEILEGRGRRIVYGEKLQVALSLGATAVDRTVSLVSRLRGRADITLRSGIVPVEGVTWTVKPAQSGVLAVEYDGDAATYPDADVAGGVMVTAKVALRPEKVVGKKGRFHLTRVRTGARFQLTLKPRLPDAEMFVALSIKDGKRWRPAGSIRDLAMGPTGRRTVVVPAHPSLIGRQVRVRAEGPNNERSVDPAASGWVYFMFVR